MKTAIGYFIRLLGIFFALSVIGNLILLIKGDVPENTTGKFENIAALIIAGVLSFLCFKYSNRKFDKLKAERLKKKEEEKH